jgi:hypothetical protein
MVGTMKIHGTKIWGINCRWTLRWTMGLSEVKCDVKGDSSIGRILKLCSGIDSMSFKFGLVVWNFRVLNSMVFLN